MIENFLKNYENILKFIDSKNNENGIQRVYIYNMNTNINYIELKKKLIDTRRNIENEKELC